MSDPALALQKTIRDRLIASPALVDLCPTDAILDRSGRPELDTCILIADSSTLFHLFHAKTYAEFHIWVSEEGLTGAKEIGGAIQDALKARPWNAPGYYVSHLQVISSRYMRDPDGFSHGVVTVEAIVQ